MLVVESGFRKMELKVRIIGVDSIGSRSLAVVVEAGGVKIFIDPGVSVAPRRFGLPPHPLELRNMCSIKRRIVDELEDSDIVVITHYHYDHYLYRAEDSNNYAGKILLVKNPERNINYSQKIRAYRFFKKNNVAELARKVHYLDSREFKYEDITIRGSPPFPHGAPGTKLGYIVMATIECCDIRLLYGSDAQGPIDTSARDYVIQENPDILVISGPPLYLSGTKIQHEEVEQGIRSIRSIANSLKNSIIIVDHHSARSFDYLDLLTALKKINPRSMAGYEYMGVEPNFLELKRRELWREAPARSDYNELEETSNCY